eukprot:1033649-Pelagomonas_calceolata.AAC.2
MMVTSQKLQHCSTEACLRRYPQEVQVPQVSTEEQVVTETQRAHKYCTTHSDVRMLEAYGNETVR